MLQFPYSTTLVFIVMKMKVLMRLFTFRLCIWKSLTMPPISHDILL